MVVRGRGQRCPRPWTTDNSACVKKKRAGGNGYVPCMDGRKRRVETEVWQLVMSSGPTGIFVGVWGEGAGLSMAERILWNTVHKYIIF